MHAIRLARCGRAALAFAVLATCASFVPAVSGRAAEASTTEADIHKDIEATLGSVPSFIRLLPKAALAGAWQEEKDLELSDDTALPPKTKALISLAVAAQIPCDYCVWADTATAKRLGATDEEIGEAVAMAALTRHWSTLFNGLQVDKETFRREFGAAPEAAPAK
jgi:AhpD family alkylhydroperoxidase